MSNSVTTGGNEPFSGTGGTTVGRSVESQAQLLDAARESSTFVEHGETLGIYKLVPIAALNDHNWDIAPSRGNMIVAALTTGDARVVAAAFEVNFMKSNFTPGESVATMGAKRVPKRKTLHGHRNRQRSP